MAGLVETGLRLLRSLVGDGSGAQAPLPGLPTALRGSVAVAVAEACVAEAAGLGAGAPADVLTRAWEQERGREGLNLFGSPLSDVSAPTPRGTMASAIGMSLAGTRATAFLSGASLAGQHDLLTAAAGRHAPMVIHGVSRALHAHAGARGSGHEAWHAVADAGVIQLMACNVQEAVDFAIIGHRVAEEALRPVLVLMDEERTASVTQDLLLPSAELVRRFLGAPGDNIDCATPGQRMLFGRQRRRIPRWHDLERPVLQGAIQGRRVWSLGAAARRPYSSETLVPLLERAFEEFATHTGRRHHLVNPYHMDDAELVLVSQGSSSELVRTVVDHLRSTQKVKLGALAVSCLRPFPGPQLAKALVGRREVGVLERVDAPLACEPPLIRELRASLDRGRENMRNPGTHEAYPLVAAARTPRLQAVIYGMGGFPLCAGDLVALVEELERGSRPLVYLGIDFQRPESRYPKRQALIDQLARTWPGEVAPGVRGYANLDVRPEGTATVSVHRVGGTRGTALAADIGRLLQVALGGHVRGRADESWERWQAPCVDRVVHASRPVDAGAAGPVDVAVVLGLSRRSARDPLADLRAGGTVLVADPEQEGVPLLPQATWRQLEARGARVIPVSCPDGPRSPAFRERIFGLLLRLVAPAGAQQPSRKKLLAARRGVLADLPQAQLERRMGWFEAALDAEPRPLPAPERQEEPSLPEAVPMAVRHFKRADGSYDSLPRFWDQVGILFRDGHTQELLPDPYLAAGVIPPLTSTFNDLTPLRRGFPRWDPVTCTGCGRCWWACPDSAIGPMALGVARLLQGALDLAAGEGHEVESLRPVLGKLAGRVSKQLRETTDSPEVLGPVLREAFRWYLGKAKLPVERAQALSEAFEPLAQPLDTLPIAGTEPFFVEPERSRSGSGELISLAFNPDACKGCGLCEAVCDEGAVLVEPQTPELVAQARSDWRRWEQLPDCAGETIARVRQHAQVGSVAAMLLSRSCLLGLAGGDSAEAGSGEKVAVRLLLAAAEYRLQPELQRHLERIEGLHGRLIGEIHRLMAQALPTGDPAALARGLRGMQRPEIDLAELVAGVEDRGEKGRVDVSRLRRLADLAGRLQDLRWRLQRGPDGLGRARIALAIEPGPVAAWAGAFPDNPFHVPVVVAGSGEGIHLARGLFEGQLRAVLADLRLVREAQVALERPGEYAREVERLAQLSWRDLADDERRLVPPVVVVGNEASLTGRNLSTLAMVLDLDVPLKVLVLADLDLGLSGGAPGADPDEAGCGWSGALGEVGLLALGSRRAVVHQGSLAYPEQLFEGLSAALSHLGPALVRVHSPSPSRHGIPVDGGLRQAALAVQSRAFPLFRFDPTEDGVFGSCLHLDGNPSRDEPWARDEQGRVITAADWALTEERFAEHLSELGPDADPVPFAEWLERPLHLRHGHTPYVVDRSAEGAGRLGMSPLLAAVAEERQRTWRTLQELAGVVTPFIARVREQAEAELQARHEQEQVQLREQHQRELTAQAARLEQELVVHVREGLLSLAGYQAGGSAEEEG